MSYSSIILSLLTIITLNTFGQNQEGFKDYDWFQAKYVKFKPGKVATARQLLKDYLYKANEISGRLVLTFESDFGDWDHIAYLHLKDGPKQLSYENAEIESKWWKGVVELVGSEQEAMEIIKDYQDCILNEKYSLVRMHNMENQMSRR
ncbi:MAG: hypothetical protein RJQ09_11185 [Cyclobacteriaceae bacterium]